jgi:hypothetical protein
MKQTNMHCRRLIFCVLCGLTCAGCSEPADTSPAESSADVVQTSRQQNPASVPGSGQVLDAAEYLDAQTALREKFDGWQREAEDETKPVEERQAALGALAERAKRASGVEQKSWGTVRHQLIDEESAKVLRRLAMTAEKAEIRMRAIETLGQLKDIDGMEVLIAGMEDESLEVRQAAVSAVRNIMSTDYGFHPDDPPEERAKAVASARKFWAVCKANARFVEGVRNPALLKRWKAAARWKEPDAEDFRLGE